MNCICPYCDKEMDDPDDCYETDTVYDHACPHCRKAFVFTLEYEKVYSESRADCLNGGEHTYEATITLPEEFTRLRCTQCGDEKPLNKDQESLSEKK